MLLFAEGIDFIKLLPIAIFLSIAAVAWIVLEWFSARSPRAEQRLDEFRDPTLRKKNQEAAARAGTTTEAMTRVLEKASPALAKPLQPKTENEVGKLRQRLSSAGFRSEAAATMFLGLKFVCLMIGVVMGGGSMVFVYGLGQTSLFRTVLIAGLMFYLPDMLLWYLGSRRKEQVFLGLPDALDLMVVCVEAGLGLDQAMRKVSSEMEKSYRVISEEFNLCNLHLQMGRSRNQALTDLGRRSGVEDLSALASILIQADKFGSSIAQALRVQSESMRTRRKQMAEEKAAKTAVKLIFPLVIFIFPGIFVVLVGPAAITMVREMFPAMQGGG